MDLGKAWSNLDSLRAWSDFLQWAAIVLVFLGGLLQVVTYVINRREKTLEALETHPRRQVITLGTATVELFVASEEQISTNFMDSGGYCIFGRGTEPLLVMASRESSARQTGDGRVLWRGVFHLDARDPSVGKPIGLLSEADFVQIGFWQMRKPAKATGGSIVVILNGTVRLTFSIPAQEVKNEYVTVRDLSPLHSLLH